jgi:iron complex outermembrane receptor protein
LPRFSTLFKITPALVVRFGGGLGYKTPTVFNEESEKIQFQNILPINEETTVNERSAGGSVDGNYRLSIGRLGVAINQLLFYTRLNKPLILATRPNGSEFVNASGHIDTRGPGNKFAFHIRQFQTIHWVYFCGCRKPLQQHQKLVSPNTPGTG